MELLAQASLAAINDAGLAIADIDAVFQCYRTIPGVP